MSIDSYRFLDFATRQIMKAWAARQEHGVIPFTPLAKPLRECTVALVSTAVARNASKGLPPPPIVALLQKKPWLLANLYSGRVPSRDGPV